MQDGIVFNASPQHSRRSIIANVYRGMGSGAIGVSAALVHNPPAATAKLFDELRRLI